MEIRDRGYEERRLKVLGSRLYRSGETFSAKNLTHMYKFSPDESYRTLSLMCLDGDLIRIVSGTDIWYARPTVTREWMCKPWRTKTDEELGFRWIRPGVVECL